MLNTPVEILEYFMKKFSIYRATNKLNGKCYIGMDSNWPHRRAAHKHAVKKGSTLRFHNFIRKHGWDVFEWEVLYESLDQDYILNQMENFFICEYRSNEEECGYNMTNGGEATFGWSPSDETKRKISASNIGKKSWNKGMKLPDHMVENNRKAQTGLKRISQRKWYKLTSPAGEVTIIQGLEEFCKRNNLNMGNLCSVAKGRLMHYKKWKCEYHT